MEDRKSPFAKSDILVNESSFPPFLDFSPIPRPQPTWFTWRSRMCTWLRRARMCRCTFRTHLLLPLIRLWRKRRATPSRFLRTMRSLCSSIMVPVRWRRWWSQGGTGHQAALGIVKAPAKLRSLPARYSIIFPVNSLVSWRCCCRAWMRSWVCSG